MDRMSKRERLLATLAGAPTDRPPAALWRHWPGDDQRAADLARATLDFQHAYDWDLVKCMPSSAYCIADWGAGSRYIGNEEGTRAWGPRVIQQPEDWTRLPVLDPTQGALGDSLQALRLIGKGLGPDVPFIQTIFSPLAQAKNLAGERLLPDMRGHPDEFKAGLETITRSILRYLEVARATGIAGIFYALQHATYDLFSAAEYAEFGRPYDLRILAATEGLWFNMLHIHGANVMFDAVADYPVQAVNWHDRETPPALRDALARFPGALVGGLSRLETMVRGTPDDVRREARDALAQTAGRRLIVGTGCVLFLTTPAGNIRAVREVVGA
jgi:uroporphyrinogen decarboxylase